MNMAARSSMAPSISTILFVSITCIDLVSPNGNVVYDSECSMETDRHVCALPSSYAAGTFNNRNCYIGVNVFITLWKKCDGLTTFALWVEDDRYLYRAVSNPATSIISRNDSFVHVFFNISTQQVKNAFGRPYKSVKFLQEAENMCRVSPCGIHGTRSKVVIERDHWPILKFEVFNGTTVAVQNTSRTDSNLSCNSTSSDTMDYAIPIMTQESSSNILEVNIDALDQDVFDSNPDAFEYSTINEADVNLTALLNYKQTVKSGNMSDNVTMQSALELLKLRAESFGRGTNWFKKTLKKIAENHVRVQYSVDVPALIQSAFLPLQYFYLSDNSTPSFDATVTLTFNVTITSGRVYQQTCWFAFTLSVLIASQLLIPPSPEPANTSTVAERVEHASNLLVPILIVVLVSALVGAALAYYLKHRRRRPRPLKQEVIASSECNAKLTAGLYETSEGSSTRVTSADNATNDKHPGKSAPSATVEYKKLTTDVNQDAPHQIEVLSTI